ncbi:MAG TPA: sensor histidine kinase [Ktedonobacteraceae bacterium]|jgi:signal transduction histidine kinase
MKFKQVQIIQTQSTLLSDWYLRWAPWVAYGFACVGYLSGVFTTQHLTLIGFLLLTITYSTWLAIFHIGHRRLEVRSHPRWLLALFCLACISQFIPLPSTNVYWLPMLPVMTATLMTMLKPTYLGLLGVGILLLCSYLVIHLIIPDWDISGQANLVISFLVTVGYVTIIRRLASAHTALENSNAKLAAAHRQLQEYSAQVEELSVIRERNRIAREIHDTLGHALTLLAVQIETATQLEVRGDPRLHEELLEARQVAKACLTEVRHSVEALRPDEASASSLQKQLRKLAADFETACRETRITLDLEEVTHSLYPELCLALYRCAQEALTNIRKHTHATKVLLRLSTSGERQDQVELTVLDNGQDCPPEHECRTSGFGLLGMRERIELLDGTLHAGPEPRHGWRVEVVLPLKQQKPAESIAMSTDEARDKV